MNQDQKEKPGEKKRGTFQEEGEEGPTDLKKPREAAAKVRCYNHFFITYDSKTYIHISRRPRSRRRRLKTSKVEFITFLAIHLVPQQTSVPKPTRKLSTHHL